MTEQTLDIKKHIDELKTMYKEEAKSGKFNMLLLGETGAGKTYLMRTARKPVHIDSFDPGGTRGLREWIEKGEIIVDTRWEKDSRLKPKMYAEWKRVMSTRERIGYFNHLGTYVIDSATTWAESIMNWLLAQAGIAGEIPRFTKDYQPQKFQIRNYLSELLKLPCDFILTGHLKFDADNDAKDLKYRMLTTGDGVTIIPLMFDEIYVAYTKQSSSGLEYSLITKNVGQYIGRTRIGGDKFDTYEKPDVKYLLKKAGLPSDDKPLLTGG